MNQEIWRAKVHIIDDHEMVGNYHQDWWWIPFSSCTCTLWPDLHMHLCLFSNIKHKALDIPPRLTSVTPYNHLLCRENHKEQGVKLPLFHSITVCASLLHWPTFHATFWFNLDLLRAYNNLASHKVHCLWVGLRSQLTKYQLSKNWYSSYLAKKNF